MKKFLSIAEKIELICCYISGACMLFIATYITVNIVIRQFGHTLLGANEISTNVNVIIASFGIGYCALADGHIKVDIFKKGKWIDHLWNFVTIAVCIFLFYYSLQSSASAQQLHKTTTSLQMEKWPFYAATAIGYILIIIAVIVNEIKLIVKAKYLKTHPDEELPYYIKTTRERMDDEEKRKADELFANDKLDGQIGEEVNS